MRTPKQSTMLSELDPLKEKVPPEPLESLMNDAGEKKDAAACRQLHSLATSLKIQMSPLTLEVLARAYYTDVDSLRGLVEEAQTPPRKTTLSQRRYCAKLMKPTESICE